MPSQHFKGVYPATPAPYTPDGQLNRRMLADLVEAQLQAGVNGFYVSGGTGEGILHSVEERIETVRIVMDQVRGRCRVIAHVGTVSTRDAVALARGVASLGVDAISALPPILYRVPFKSILDFYARIASEAGKPMLAYYIPGMNGLTFTADQFDELLAVENVVGVKFSEYNLFLMQQILDRHPESVVMSGNDEVLLPALSIGAHGAIGLTPNIMPALFVELYDAFLRGDLKTALELQAKANRVIRIMLECGAGGLGALKPVLRMIGFDCGAPREPLPQLDVAEIDRLRRQLTEIDFFSDPIYLAWAKDRVR